MKFSETLLARHMQPINGSAIREIFHLLGKSDMISFAGGNPAASALEPDVISQIAQETLSVHGWPLLQYGATEGFAPLRDSLCEFVKSAGISTRPENILPTQGSQQAFDLLLKSLIDPGDVILVESPTFLGAIQAMNTYQARLVAMPSDDKGVIVEAVEEAIKTHHPKLMYIIPTFQNPSGKTLPLERRKALAQLANRYGVVIAEDDPYRDLRYSGEPIQSIKSFDENGFVVYLGSFSKLISPGLRVGYAVVDAPALMRKMVIGKQSVDVHSPILNQAIVDTYLRKGLLGDHVKRICASYKAQLDKMLDMLKCWPEGSECTHPEGGLFVWVELPQALDATQLFVKATERSVAYVPGTHFYFDGGHNNTLRLNFSNSSLESIEKGMRILGELFCTQIK